ncbi:MAG: DUF624 domain-containing protein [Ruminococcaceae bacterium]|nr:DUF624 domain-containing protein [Oscillospiraceae bacterium]
MIQFFNPENKFWSFVGKLTDAVLMGMLWLLTSLPVLTLGASTTAFYAFTLRQVSDTEGPVWKNYFDAFRRFFKKATALWAIQLALGAFFALDLWAALRYRQSGGGMFAVLVLAVCAAAAFLFLGAGFYAYPILAIFDFPVKKMLRDSFIMAMANLPVTFTLFVMLVLAAVAFYYASGLLFLWAALFVFFSSYLIYGVFARYAGLADGEAADGGSGDEAP